MFICSLDRSPAMRDKLGERKKQPLTESQSPQRERPVLVGFAQEVKINLVFLALRLISLSEIKPKTLRLSVLERSGREIKKVSHRGKEKDCFCWLRPESTYRSAFICENPCPIVLTM